MLADALARRWRLSRFRRDGPTLRAEGTVLGQAVLLLEPQTSMNRSGIVARALLGLPDFEVARDLLVLVDEFALSLGTLRLRARGSSGGHNGLQSVEDALGTREYARLRIGIGPLPSTADDPADWVLEPFTRVEREAIENLLPLAAEAVESWLTEGIETAMNRFNRRGPERE